MHVKRGAVSTLAVICARLLCVRRFLQLYVALFPCNECTKLILQSGISEVIYASDKHATTYPVIAAKRMLDMAGITYRQHAPALPEICIRFG
ncbi:hypothetical protein EON67_05875 [archaeon]|nr:MAG: hypothetical protein EON67_05875 [archaeon]